MEEYHRDSLREFRRASEVREPPAKAKGSFWVTLLIIGLFALAGGFYLKTENPQLFQKYFNVLKGWKEEAVSVFRQEPDQVEQTVDAALAEQNEAG